MKKILIILGILIALIGALFIIFHDNTDLEIVEKKQIESINTVMPDMMDNLESSFDTITLDTIN